VLWFCQPDLSVFGVWDVSTPKVQPFGLMSHDLMSQTILKHAHPQVGHE
jgi:hypothetical protein